MKISELKQMIKDLPDDAEVIFDMKSGCCDNKENLEIEDCYEFIDPLKPNDPERSYCYFVFKSLPGYRSCIQVGLTKRAHEEYWKQFKQDKE